MAVTVMGIITIVLFILIILSLGIIILLDDKYVGTKVVALIAFPISVKLFKISLLIFIVLGVIKLVMDLGV